MAQQIGKRYAGFFGQGMAGGRQGHQAIRAVRGDIQALLVHVHAHQINREIRPAGHDRPDRVRIEVLLQRQIDLGIIPRELAGSLWRRIGR